MITANCPNCGAPVTLQWAGAVQTTCAFCKSILIRQDTNLEKVGVSAELPSESSPVQIATEGVYGGKTFTVIGRILYEWERGGWNEWHVIFSDGMSGWLSDAQNEFAVSFPKQFPQGFPAADALLPGTAVELDGSAMQVAVVTRAHYAAVEGELPFTTWDKHQAVFIDLRGFDAKFATVDYSGVPALLYVGAAVEFGDLKLKNLRQFEGWS